MTEQKFETIEQIMAKYPVVLLDNCALQTPLEFDSAAQSGSLLRNIVRTESMTYFCELVKEGKGIYIARETLDEIFGGLRNRDYKLLRGKSSYLRARRRKEGRVLGEGLNDRIFETDTARDYHKARRMVANVFKKNRRIFSLNESEKPLHAHFFKGHLDLKEREYGREGSKISDVDYALMMYAATASQTRKGCALVTNDSALLLAWAEFMMREPINLSEYGAYRRSRLNGYTKPVPAQIIQIK